tara:strand:+ start:69723 stop:69932 length:210 start_codon:yes stop_codon:yes gene_type:complete
MANEYGLDVNYFSGKIEIIQRDISRYKPDELARELARLSVAADEKVLTEPEFVRVINVSNIKGDFNKNT